MWQRVFYLSVVLVGTAALAGLTVFNPSIDQHLFPKCSFFVSTGLHCPGCGGQRGMYFLLHGHWLNAARSNCLVFFVVPLTAYSVVRWTKATWNLNWLKLPLIEDYVSPRMIVIGGILIVLFTIVRNIPVPPFTMLAPAPLTGSAM